MRWISRGWRGPAVLAGLVAVLVIGSLVALGPRVGFTAGSAHLWTERSPALSQTTTAAPAWVEIAKALKPAVVNISTLTPRKAAEFDDFFRSFRGPAPRMVHGLGSGFIISPGGDIVTNNHVVDGATEIKITMSDGREFPGKVLGRDPKTDVALLKIDARDLPVIPLGDTAQVQVGEPVMAIGNPFGLEQTVTTGIVSATGRVIGEGPYDDFIQTDAAINPGNSGGPLINARGQAIGINTAIFSRTGGSVGVGFAIPVNLAKSVITQLASTGHVARGWLGVTIQRLTPALAKSFELPEAQGALVTDVQRDSPAAAAGLRPGDVIVAYNGRKVVRSEDLPRAVADTPAGQEVAIGVLRHGQPVTLQARVASLQDEQSGPSQVASEDKGTLGVAVQTVTPDVARELGLDQARGVAIRAVRDGSPAARAGLHPGDVIVAVDGQPVKTAEDLKGVIQKHPAGRPTLLLVHREGGNLFVAVG